MLARTVARFLCAIVLGSLVAPEPGYAGAWTLRRGHVWGEFYWQQYVADHDFDRDGRRVRKVNDGDFREFRNEFKLEWAPPWHDRFNILVSAPLDYSRYVDRNVTLTNHGWEEATVSGKWRFNSVRAPVVVAVQAGVNFPLGCDVTEQPPLGDCQTDVEGRLLFSRALRTDVRGIITAYLNADAGYRIRRDAPTDEVPFFIESAWQVGTVGPHPFWLKGFVDGVQSRAGEQLGQVEDYAKWSAGVMWGRDPESRDASGVQSGFLPLLEVGVGGVFAGRNTGAGKVVFVKLAFQH